VLLLHGYPQSNVMWHRVAPALAREHALVIPDLPGYGQSDAPEAAPDHSPYTKRAMAQAMVEVMDKLGHRKFAVVGHDRGARVGYRLALDHPDRVSRLSVLDIIPTWEMWANMNAKRAMKVFHWTFLAQPYPLPEMLIGKAPLDYMEWKMLAWNGGKDNSIFDPRAFEHYRAFFAQPARLHATCEDYRAGQSTDVVIDDADVKARRKIECPVLALWGTRGIPAAGESPLDVWRRWARQVEGKAIDCGHFLAEENPDDTVAALLPFLRG
jgi:haloacetate dehalogenase